MIFQVSRLPQLSGSDFWNLSSLFFTDFFLSQKFHNLKKVGNMNYKSKRFLAKSNNQKITILFSRLKRGIVSLLELPFFPLVKLLFQTRIGRDCLYSALPKNELVMAKTNEGLHYVVNTSDDEIGRVIFRDRKSFDSQVLTEALNLIGKDKSIIVNVGANVGTI